jgi:hypothetical protein
VTRVVHLIAACGCVGWVAYLTASLSVWLGSRTGRDVPELARTIRAELKPFALWLLLAEYAPIIAADATLWNLLGLGFQLSLWLFYRRGDDDDLWKRRRKKLADKVAEVGGRLVLVPVTSPP